MTPLVDIEDLAKGFTRHHLGDAIAPFDGISFSVAAGEFLLLKGSNGAGTSTLLRTHHRSDLPQAGVIRFHLDHEPMDLARAALMARLAELKDQGTAMIGVLHHPGDVLHLIDRIVDLTPDAAQEDRLDVAL